MSSDKNNNNNMPIELSDRQKAEFFDILNEHLNVGVSIMDENLDYVFISKNVYEQLSITEDELGPGDNLSDCHALMTQKGLLNDEIVEENRLSAERQMQQSEGDVTNLPTKIRLANGRTHELIRKTLTNGMTISMSHEISTLVETDKMLEEALNLGKSGYWLYDFKTKTYSLSDSLRNYFTPEQRKKIQESGVIALIHPADRAQYRDALKNIAKTGDKFSITCRSENFLHEERWGRTDGQIIRDETGKPVQIRAFVKDMTETRAQQLAFEAAKDDAIAASKAKSEFLANMSHEIRTPMNGVLGMAELLEQSDIDDRQRDYIKVISRSSQALLTIINDILDFSKIEAGAFELETAQFNMREAIDDVMALLASKAHEKGLELIVNYAPNLLRNFIGDAGRFRQVITNLVGNAIKFTQEGHILVSVDAKDQGNGAATLSINVEDTGIGIEQSKIDAVFQKFTQADNSTTRVYGGTGLGLTISRRIVELMDGDITATSIFGEGSTFTITMNLPIDTQIPNTPITASELSGKKVLIVDDIKINRDILMDRLASWKLRTEAVADGVDALVALKSAVDKGDPFDIIVLDYLMPGMNGHELAMMITANDALRGTPMVILSSCDQPVDSKRLRQMGVAVHLVKPIREKRLYSTLCRVLSGEPESLQLDDSSEDVGQPIPQSTHHDEPVLRPLKPTKPAEPEAAPKLNASEDVSDTLAEIETVLNQIDPQQERHKPETPAQELVEPISAKANEPVTENTNRAIDILVAEDFPLNQDVVKLMLEDSRYKPHFANNGQEAVGMFKANPTAYSAILMDVSMPVMDGYEASEIITAFQRLTGAEPTPIIALTGHALKHDREKCLDSNMDDYLTKPVKQSDLIGALDKWVFGAGASAKKSA